MKLSFRVNGNQHEVEISEWGDLPEMLAQLHDEVVEACGQAKPAADLQARLYIAALHSLVDQSDLDVGEVVETESSDAA